MHAVAASFLLALSVVNAGAGATHAGPLHARLTLQEIAALSGVVVDGTSNRPLSEAVVAIGPAAQLPDGYTARVLTDAQGRYVFRGLRPYSGYTLTASKAGYVTASFREHPLRPQGTRIALDAGEWLPTANLTLWPLTRLSGRVTDQLGQPIAGAYVRALQRLDGPGALRVAAGPVTRTDIDGAYSFNGLIPGDYVLCVPIVQSTVPEASAAAPGLRPGVAASGGLARVDDHRVAAGLYPAPAHAAAASGLVYSTAFHGAAVSLLSAVPLTLDPAQALTDVDIELRASPGFSIRGRVDGPRPADGTLMLRLVPAGLESAGVALEAATAVVAPDGSFVFAGVPAGGYVILSERSITQIEQPAIGPDAVRLPLVPGRGSASASQSTIRLQTAPPLRAVTRGSRAAADDVWTHVPVTVQDRDLLDLVVPLQRAGSVRGRVVWDDGGEFGSRGRPRAVSLRLEPADADPALGIPRTAAGAEGFELTDVLPGAYVVRVTGNARPAAVTVAGRDISHEPLVVSPGQTVDDVAVTLTNASAQLEGTVRDDSGAPAADAFVVAFSTDPSAWSTEGFTPMRVAIADVQSDGRFAIRSLPPGEYYAIALPADRLTRWPDPAQLRAWSGRAPRIVVTAGSASAVSLSLGER